MATFYRGAGVDTYWHKNDALRLGFTPQDPGASFSCDRLMQHIGRTTTHSKFISLTRSYGVAYDYAMNAGLNWPSKSNPAYIYEIETSSDHPEFRIVDPLKEIIYAMPDPAAGNSYHHDGQQSFLLGVVDPVSMGAHLQKKVLHPPPHLGTPRAPNLSLALETMIRVLRDAELLAIEAIPRSCVKHRFEVY